MHKLLVCLVAGFLVKISPAQVQPMKGALRVSGSFGELRKNHFHAGVDIKTGGEIGKSLFATKSGYISRVKVSGGGYGNAVYITSPKHEKITVYAHLNRFVGALAKHVKAYQYRHKTHSLDLSFPPGKFPVKEGEIIGKSGNSGSSFGPHLHYEVRDLNNIALHPQAYGLKLQDSKAPVLQNLYLFQHSDFQLSNIIQKKPFKVLNGKGGARLKADTLEVSGLTSFGINGFDRFDLSSNKCGFYSIQIVVDSLPVYTYKVDSLSFLTTKNINAHLDYELLKTKGRWVHTSYVKPNNKLMVYKDVYQNGCFRFLPGSIYKVRVKATDFMQNTTELAFVAKGVKEEESAPVYGQNVFKASYALPHYFDEGVLQVRIPRNSLYDDAFVEVKLNEVFNKRLASNQMFEIGSETIPLQKSFEVDIEASLIEDSVAPEKVCVVQLRKNEIVGALKTRYQKGRYIAKSKRFGQFGLALDTVPPVIKPRFKKSKLKKAWSMSFKLRDALSGIKKVDGYIDGKWVLFEYNYVKHQLLHKFDSTVMPFNKKHHLKIVATDNKNNRKEYHLDFFR